MSNVVHILHNTFTTYTELPYTEHNYYTCTCTCIYMYVCPFVCAFVCACMHACMWTMYLLINEPGTTTCTCMYIHVQVKLVVDFLVKKLS